MMSVNTNRHTVTWQTVVECTVRGGPGEVPLEGAIQASLRQMATAVRPLCLPDVCVTQLQDAIADAAGSVLARAGDRPCDMAITMRVLAPRLECPTAGQPAGHMHGWGFYLIEKTAGACQAGQPVHHMIDLFLYVEGEGE